MSRFETLSSIKVTSTKIEICKRNSRGNVLIACLKCSYSSHVIGMCTAQGQDGILHLPSPLTRCAYMCVCVDVLGNNLRMEDRNFLVCFFELRKE